MNKKNKLRLFYFIGGMVTGGLVWLGVNGRQAEAPDASSADCGRPAPIKAEAQAAKAPAPMPAGAPNMLPPIPVVEGEAEFLNYTNLYIELLKEEDGDKSEKLAQVLKAAKQALSKNYDLPMLFMYKYPLRSAAEMLLKSGKARSVLSEDEFNYFYSGDKLKELGTDENCWSFSGFENGIYDAFFSPVKAFENKELKVSPLWSCQAAVAVRTRNFAEMNRLHNESGAARSQVWPLESLRQICNYASYRGGEEQLKMLRQVVPDSVFSSDSSWCEIGYGSGKMLGPLSRAFNGGGTIYGTEIDDFCIRAAKAVKETGVSGWGNIIFRGSQLSDCLMPENSVNVIHAGLIHIGDGNEQTWERDWLPFLASVKKALKPGGYIIVDDGGVPGIEQVRKIMKIAGFEEDKIYYQPHSNAQYPVFVVSFKPIK